MARIKSALQKFVEVIKDDDKAERSPSNTLRKIIDDYCQTGKFDQYLYDHRKDMAKYINDPSEKRPTRYRASQAGRCVQEQAFNALVDVLATNTLKFEQAKLALTPKQLLEIEQTGSTLVGKQTVLHQNAGAAEKVIIKRPAHNMRALWNGTMVHVRWHLMFDALDAEGLVKTLAVEKRFVNQEFNVSGTIDRIVAFRFLDTMFVALCDFKSMAIRYFQDLNVPKMEHFWQQHCYKLCGVDEPSWGMLYEEKDKHLLKIYFNKFSDVAIRRLQDNYVMMDQWIDQFIGGVPVESRVKLPLTTDWCKWCEWQTACSKENPNLATLQAEIRTEEESEPVF